MTKPVGQVNKMERQNKENTSISFDTKKLLQYLKTLPALNLYIQINDR